MLCSKRRAAGTQPLILTHQTNSPDLTDESRSSATLRLHGSRALTFHSAAEFLYRYSLVSYL